MSVRADSLAGRAFSAAEDTLHALEFADPRLAPPLSLLVEPAPVRHDGASQDSMEFKDGPLGVPIELRGFTLTEATAALEAGTTTTRDLLEWALAIAAETSALGTIAACDEEAARAEADRLDAERRAGHLRGPLHGLPLTVKDVIDVAGLPTRAGSLAYDDLPRVDAIGVGRLRGAGGLIFAKVATHEFALGVTTPQCRNPHDLSRISGGSSGGSAIAVATGVGVGSLGTDTRASLRVPAALCGVVGFKPTFGRVPTRGIVPLSWTVDHLGPITRTVEDAAVMFDSLADAPFLSRDLSRAPGTIGIVPGVFEDADDGVAHACDAALRALADAGWTIRTIDGPDIGDLRLSNDLGLLITRAEAAAFHRAQSTDLEICIDEVRDQLRAGLTISAADYLDAQRQRQVLTERTLEQFAECDIIATPTTPVVAPPHADYERYLLRLSRYTIIWSLIGAPAVSIPCGTGESGLPVAVQLAAAPWNEQALVDAGMTLERRLRAR